MLPFRDYDEHEVINLFALEGLADAGTFVFADTFVPDDTDAFSNIAPGKAHDGTLSLRYEVKNRVKPVTGTETRHQILGVTLYNVQEVDENGEKLIYYRAKQDRLQAVVSGQAVPILRRGMITLTSDAYEGTPAIGHVGVPYESGGGKIEAVDPTDPDEVGPTGRYSEDQVIGKFISSVATRKDSSTYAVFLLDL